MNFIQILSHSMLFDLSKNPKMMDSSLRPRTIMSSLLSRILQPQYRHFVIKRRSVIQRRVAKGAAKGREGLKGGMSAAHQTFYLFFFFLRIYL